MSTNDESKLLECAICFETMNQPVTLPKCGHSFCIGCARSHLEDEKCPKCNVTVPASLALAVNPMLRDMIADNDGPAYRARMMREKATGELVTFMTVYEDSTRAGGESIEGKIADIVPGQSFAVRFSGSREFTSTYVRRGGRYVLASGEALEGC